ncbi:hypothetical protein TIFTF001_034419 [Ficus carica]|uniref:Uncharacterized protein n=1 Tax=Ficus carica TaxID=3494 RepID=A0AA88E0E7_FICCA|nr:hypothetical protein TIFTF001_034419 [Ficus carica]
MAPCFYKGRWGTYVYRTRGTLETTHGGMFAILKTLVNKMSGHWSINRVGTGQWDELALVNKKSWHWSYEICQCTGLVKLVRTGQ